MFIKNIAFLLSVVLLTGVVVYTANAAITLSTTSVVSDGALTLTGAADSTWDIGANTLSLQTTNNGAITTGTGALTVGGALSVDGNTTLGNAATDTTTMTGTLQGASPFVFEGATADDFETTFSITDPTADRTITFPNTTITVNAAADISGTTLASNVVTSSLTTIGTIASGTWNGTTVAVGYGGTGAATFTANGVLYGNAGSTLQVTAAGTSGQLLLANGSGVPVFVSMSGDATISNAGAVSVSDLTITSEAQGDVLYYNGSNWIRLGAGTNGQYLQTQGTGANPQWATVSAGGLSNIVEDTTPQLGGMLDVNGNAIGDGTLELLKFSETASAVNELTVANAATGTSPTITASGGDDNVGIGITTKGTGNLNLTLGDGAGLTNILTGNLKVGNGSPGVTLDGEDVYIEGTLEVDGAVQFDGAVTLPADTVDAAALDDTTCLQILTNNHTQSTGSTNYGSFQEPTSAGVTEADQDDFVVPVAVKMDHLRVSVTTGQPPGSGKSWAITIRDDGADTTLTCTISNTDESCTDAVSPITVAAGSKINAEIVPGGEPQTLTGEGMIIAVCITQ